jgi:hypothetical protein
MKKLAASAVFAALAIVCVTNAAARSPLDEKVRLNKTDMALASRLTFRRLMLAPGWTAEKASPFMDDSYRTRCPGTNFDSSAFTITGHHESAFKRTAAQHVESDAAVFATAGQARGDFLQGVRHKKAVSACIAKELVIGVGKQHIKRLARRTTTIRVVGERNIDFSVTGTLTTVSGRQFRMSYDVLVVQRARVQIAFRYFTLGKTLTDRFVMARLLALRIPS